MKRIQVLIIVLIAALAVTIPVSVIYRNYTRNLQRLERFSMDFTRYVDGSPQTPINSMRADRVETIPGGLRITEVSGAVTFFYPPDIFVRNVPREPILTERGERK